MYQTECYAGDKLVRALENISNPRVYRPTEIPTDQTRAIAILPTQFSHNITSARN